jgi:hypothetical protein
MLGEKIAVVVVAKMILLLKFVPETVVPRLRSVSSPHPDYRAVPVAELSFARGTGAGQYKQLANTVHKMFESVRRL